MKKIILTRDSVAMGDDMDAPHRMEMEINETWNILEILDKVRSLHYLPLIAGGKAHGVLR